jgi:hypothetical protein
MNNLYRKVAVASVGIALGFALGANKEAKAATFTFVLNNSFLVWDANRDGLGDYDYGGVPLPVGISPENGNEFRAFYEFNIANLSLASNTVISSAIFEGMTNSIEYQDTRPSYLNVIGYVGNGSNDVSDFSKEGVFGSILIQSLSPGSNFQLDATTFIKQIVNNRETFAGFGFRITQRYPSYITLSSDTPTLTITTVDVTEPVPEPTTILSAAVALGWGGWLKRKKIKSAR